MSWLASILTLAAAAALPAPGPPAGLEHDEILAVIQERRPALRRVCFEPIERSAPDDAVLVVRTKLRVDARGVVTSVTAEGAQTLPTLAPCVAREVGRWRFPISDDETSLMIPFRFVAEKTAAPPPKP